jgi:hypothetical protein
MFEINGARSDVALMQRFLAVLSSPIDKTEFESSWNGDPAIHGGPKVEFDFAGMRVSVVVHSEPAAQWASASFHRTFSAVIRRLNGVCNVRWL